MKYRYWLILLFSSLFSSLVYAQTEPLRISAASFSPPFVLQGGNQQLFGFDISMMQSLCQIMARPCNFIPMEFDNIIPSLTNNNADLAIGGITITAERAKTIFFSDPYLPSHAVFVTNSDYFDKPWKKQLLTDKQIGLIQGSVFPEIIQTLNLDNPTIVRFEDEHALIEALSLKEIDFALLDTSTAYYWEMRSADTIKPIGQPINYGLGLGIAIAPDNPDLLKAVNRALLQYQQSPDFKKHYNTYFKSAP